MNLLRGVLVALALSLVACTAPAEPVKTPHVTSELVAQARGAAPGQTVWLAVAAAPKASGMEATVQSVAGKMSLAMAGGPLINAAKTSGFGADAYFYPYDDRLIDHAGAQGVDRGARGLTLALAPGAAFTSGA